MKSVNSNKKIMEPFKVTQELLQKTQGIQESKEDLAMMGMNGQVQINRNILHRHKVMWCHKKLHQWENAISKNRDKNHLSKLKITKTWWGIKADIAIMPLMLLVRKAARSSGAAVVVKENKRSKDHIIIISQNKLKIILGRRTKNLRSSCMKTINSILRTHHLVRTMRTEWTTKGSRTDMITLPIWDKISIKMHHNHKWVKDQQQDPAPSPLWNTLATHQVVNPQSLSEKMKKP